MTTARLVSNPAEGHGLTQRITDPLFHALANDEDVDSIPCVVMLKPVGHGSRNTANGRKQFVQFEVAKLEPIRDDNDVEQVQFLLRQAWEARHSGQILPLDWGTSSPDDQRRQLLAILDEWAEENDLTAADVAERWRTHWGIESDTDPTDGSFPRPDINKAAPHHIKEFALMVGAVTDEPVQAVLQNGAGLLTDENDDDLVRSGKDAAAGD